MAQLEMLEEIEDNDFNLNDILDQLDNQTIRTIVIRNWKTESFLHKIFLRLNVENTPLSSQELRQALHPGGFINFLDDRAIKSQALKKIFKSSYPDFRMRDTDILLRYVAFHYYLSDYRCDVQILLDKTCQNFNQEWEKRSEEIKNIIDQFEKAVQTTINIFAKKNFSRLWLYKEGKYRSQFNRAILDVMVFYFCDDLIRATAEKNKEQIENAFKELLSNPDNEFRNSVEKTTKSIRATYNRFNLWGQALSKVLYHFSLFLAGILPPLAPNPPMSGGRVGLIHESTLPKPPVGVGSFHSRKCHSLKSLSGNVFSRFLGNT